ncbi:1130_t:CDS:10 [Funneliformis geosporum]|uniref:Nuclear pore protein n=1 Tax=Funneliformis geosporum TaxID=1117311 RepID=A0A9W4SII0_9GLOM|nr:1130_t:CDS:10 [Funneliformis geosporum]CAI2170672.1 5315_t:CDS:10 [Funneliformis geosporum]
MAANQLKELAERSRKVANAIIKQDIPPIERNLEQIEKQSRKLADKVIKPGEEPERKAPYFLANIGIDGDRLSQEVKSINVLGAFEPREILPDTDVEKFIEHKHQQTISSIIKDGHIQTVDDYNSYFDRCLVHDWDRTKRRVFEELGQHIPTSTSSDSDLFSTPGSSRSRFQTPLRGTTTSSFIGSSTPRSSYVTAGERKVTFRSESTLPLNQRHLVYFDVVSKLNNHRLSKLEYGVINEFTNAAKKINVDYVKKLVQCWQSLISIIGENNVIEGRFTRNPLKEHHYARAYLAPVSSPENKALYKALLNGAKRYLEESYRSYTSDYVNSFRNEALLGGQPSVSNTARAILRAIHRPNGGIPINNLQMAENIPIWGHIFILLRQGHYQDALQVAQSYKNIFSKQDQTFITYFTKFITNNNSLPLDDRQKLVTEIKQWPPLPQLYDPYKCLLYQIVAQMEELPQKPQTGNISPTFEDFMWQHLMCVREINIENEPVSGILSLERFQKKVRDLGPAHFNHNGKDPVQYFRVLLLTLQFERYTEDAVHFAIALAYYGLLRVPDSAEAMALIIDEEESRPKLNFNTIIYQYVRMLANDNAPNTAFQYLILLYLYGRRNSDSGLHQIEMCHYYVRQLVYDTEAFAELVGDVQNREGQIKKYMSLMYIDNEREFNEIIVGALARQCVEDGKFKAAQSLYELTENYEEIIILLNKMLAEYIWVSVRGVTMQPETAQEFNPQEIKKVLHEYKTNQITMSLPVDRIQTCEKLLGLVDFIEMYKMQNYENALNIIQSIDIFSFEKDVTIIKQKAAAIEMFDDQLKKCLEELLLITMRCLHSRYQQLKDQTSRWSPGPSSKYMDDTNILREKANNLVTFAGYIKHSVQSTDIFQKLNELYVSMR